MGLLVFIDVHEDEIIDDPVWHLPLASLIGGRKLVGHPCQPAQPGRKFSFADGHVEHWKWKVPKAVTVPRGWQQPVADGEWDDYNRMEAGFRQNFSD